MWVARCDLSNDAIQVSVPDAVQRNPSMTPRSVACEVGIALKLVSAYPKRCRNKGLIKSGQVPPRRCVHNLVLGDVTEKSRLTATYLPDSLAFFVEARIQCNELFQGLGVRDQRRLALVGRVDLAEIALVVVRDDLIEIAGFALARADAVGLESDLEGINPFEAAVVTEVEQSRETFAEPVELLGAEGAYAPALLCVPPLPTAPAVDGDVQ
jgi:hypothetical protein